MAKRILVIDDDPLVRATLRTLLEAEGYAVSIAADGRKGLEEFQRERPDMVITDIVMPEVEGIETIREIRAAAPNLPVLAISGGGRGATQDYLRMAQRLGANDVLTKPFDPDDLLAKVQKCLGG